MDKICIKARNGYEQTGLAVKAYLDNKNVDNDLYLDDNAFALKKHLYNKVYELGEVDCVNTVLFKKEEEGEKGLANFYWGAFNFEKLLVLEELDNIHVYSNNRWPISNFIGLVGYEDLNSLANLYSKFFFVEGDQKWVYMSFVYAGCSPIVEKDIKIYTVDDYVKEIGLE